MKMMRRLLGLGAWVALAVGISVFMSGYELAAQRFMDQTSGRSHLSVQSEYVRQVYDQQVGNDADGIAKSVQVLNLAGHPEHSERLKRFFAYCNVRRLLGEDDACTRETVRSAVGEAASLASVRGWPVDGSLVSDFGKVLALSLASEQEMHDGIEGPSFWQYHRYDSPGVLVYDSPVKGAFILLAARNQSRWEIARFRATLTLPAPHSMSGSGPIVLECEENPYPFYWLHPLTPGTVVIRVCKQPEAVTLSELLDSVQQAQRDDSSSVRVQEFELKDPYVRVTDAGEGSVPRFILHSVREFTTEFAPDGMPVAVSRQVERELREMSCEKTASCPSLASSRSLAFYDFLQKNYLSIPLLVGLLMGIGFGGLFGRALSIAFTIAVGVVVCTLGLIAVWFYAAASRAPGEGRAWALWGTMGLSVVAVGALMLWVPGFFLGIMLVREPAQGVGSR